MEWKPHALEEIKASTKSASELDLTSILQARRHKPAILVNHGHVSGEGAATAL
jgi:hypothetical protein